jgi:putative flippase GtrA
VIRPKLAARYACFALAATATNLGVQRTVLTLVNGAPALYAAMLAGTLCGLVLKYVLDKRYIFFYVSRSRRDDLARFTGYVLMSLVTTAVFWGFELGFDRLLSFPAARYLGGGIGLAAGYTLKYLLDRRFVFTPYGQPTTAKRSSP